jgi:hypothetical protein
VKSIPNPSTKERSHFAKCQDACHKDVKQEFDVLQQCFAIVRYPALTWSKSQMCECMNCCVIMHNIIIESEPHALVVDDQLFDHEDRLVQLAQVSVEFAVSLQFINKFAIEMLIISRRT